MDIVRQVLIMFDETVLGGLVVIRSHDKKGVGAGLFGLEAELQGMAGIVAAGPGNDLHTACNVIDTVLDECDVLVILEGGAFAGGAADRDGSGAAGDMFIHELMELGVVDLALLGEGSDDGY